MRIAPVLVPYLRQSSPSLWADAALAGMITHNDYASNAACEAFVYMLWQLLGMSSTPPPEWWLETYIDIASQLEGETSYTPRMPGFHYSGPVWKFTRDKILRAREGRLSTIDPCNHWGSGAYLMETIPSVIYILETYGSDPEQVIVRAVNEIWDNDTVAAIVGAAVGALHGKTALPQRWLDGLLGRTGANDDGKTFALKGIKGSIQTEEDAFDTGCEFEGLTATGVTFLKGPQAGNPISVVEYTDDMKVMGPNCSSWVWHHLFSPRQLLVVGLLIVVVLASPIVRSSVLMMRSAMR